MHLYQIGRIVEPWVNLRPPLRGGIVRLHPEKEDLVNSDDDLSVAASVNAFSRASHRHQESFDNTSRRRQDEDSSDKPQGYHAWSQAYVTKLVQGDVDDDLRDYPSLDADTQRSINLKFQALHQRVKEDGYYHCNFN